MKTKKILFLHGFFTTGNCQMAKTMKGTFGEQAIVLTPDLPLTPKEALRYIRTLIDKENPDLLVGNSCGAFYAQILAPTVGIPALLSNPHFRMSKFLKERIGEHQYKSPRADGKQYFIVDEQLIKEFMEVEQVQFHYTNPYFKDKVWGIFGEQDTLAKYEPTFLEHYSNTYHFPGAHTPTDEEVKGWLVPLIEKMLTMYEKPKERYFLHFKGGKYKFIRTAFDSETQERMVIYQALYGEQTYWVRPEKMFFEKVTREGKTFNRFTEIDR